MLQVLHVVLLEQRTCLIVDQFSHHDYIIHRYIVNWILKKHVQCTYLCAKHYTISYRSHKVLYCLYSRTTKVGDFELTQVRTARFIGLDRVCNYSFTFIYMYLQAVTHPEYHTVSNTYFSLSEHLWHIQLSKCHPLALIFVLLHVHVCHWSYYQQFGNIAT